MRPALTVLAGIVVLALAGCGGSEGAQPATQPDAKTPPSSVRELDSLVPLQNAFEAAAGRPRLLLILSPT